MSDPHGVNISVCDLASTLSIFPCVCSVSCWCSKIHCAIVVIDTLSHWVPSCSLYIWTLLDPSIFVRVCVFHHQLHPWFCWVLCLFALTPDLCKVLSQWYSPSICMWHTHTHTYIYRVRNMCVHADEQTTGVLVSQVLLHYLCVQIVWLKCFPSSWNVSGQHFSPMSSHTLGCQGYILLTTLLAF